MLQNCSPCVMYNIPMCTLIWPHKLLLGTWEVSWSVFRLQATEFEHNIAALSNIWKHTTRVRAHISIGSRESSPDQVILLYQFFFLTYPMYSSPVTHPSLAQECLVGQDSKLVSWLFNTMVLSTTCCVWVVIKECSYLKYLTFEYASMCLIQSFISIATNRIARIQKKFNILVILL